MYFYNKRFELFYQECNFKWKWRWWQLWQYLNKSRYWYSIKLHVFRQVHRSTSTSLNSKQKHYVSPQCIPHSAAAKLSIVTKPSSSQAIFMEMKKFRARKSRLENIISSSSHDIVSTKTLCTHIPTFKNYPVSSSQ